MQPFRQAGRNEDVVVPDPATWPEHPSAGSQHGELRSYSSESVGMDDRVERSVAEGKSGSGRKGEMTATGQAEVFCSQVCSSYGGARYVGDDSLTSASFD